MHSNAETVTELCEHVNTLKDAVLGPIQKYSSANSGSTLPPDLNQTVETLTEYVYRLWPVIFLGHLIHSTVSSLG